MGIRIDYLGNVGGFDNVQHLRLLRACVTDGTSFRHAMMIHNARAVPKLLDMRSGPRDAASRFPSDDDRSYPAGSEVNFLFGSRLRQPDGVRGRAAHHRSAVFND